MNFSVSMCVYGRDNPDHFDVAIDSVVNQTIKPTEIVLTVDGPIPNTIEKVITKYINNLNNSDITFKIVRLKNNMGHGEARRICFDNCSYSLIALMDADDISISNRFEKEIDLFRKNEELAIVGSYISEFFGNPNDIQTIRTVGLTDEEIKKDIRIRCPMNQPSVMFKKKAVESVGGYIDWYCNEDYYLWIRLARAGYKFANINECLVNMRVDEKSYKRRGGIKYFKSEAKIQKLLLDYKMISAFRYILNVSKRLIVQVLMPNSIRCLVFKKFARKKEKFSEKI